MTISADFTPVASLVGGALIGLGASMLLLGTGRVAGISGIFGGVISPGAKGETRWRVLFVVGLLAGGLALHFLRPSALSATAGRPLALVAVAGLLVGYGTRLGSGCTSGHGVCGMSRFSKRSIVATLVFMAAGAITVLAVRLIGGGT